MPMQRLLQVQTLRSSTTAWDFQIEVVDQGHSAPRTVYGNKIDGRVGLFSGSVGSHLLKPGGSLIEHADLSEIFDLSKPGSFTVQVQNHDQRILMPTVGCLIARAQSTRAALCSTWSPHSRNLLTGV
jgi:hypothetical protein